MPGGPGQPYRNVRFQRRLADQLGQAPGRQVALEIDLQETVLRRDPALGANRIVQRFGVYIRYALLVPDHEDHRPRGAQPRFALHHGGSHPG